MKIDGFEARRAPARIGPNRQPVHGYALFPSVRKVYSCFLNIKGRFYHDWRFKTLLDVENSYDVQFHLGLSDQAKQDLVEYLKSLYLFIELSSISFRGIGGR